MRDYLIKKNHNIISKNLKEIFETDTLSQNEGWIGQMVSHPLPSNMTIDLKDEIYIYKQKNL